MKSIRNIGLVSVAVLVSACGAADRLAGVGKAPSLSAIESPTVKAGYKPVQMPVAPVEPVNYQGNSLWQASSYRSYSNNRAKQVGDILTVDVSITDNASIANNTARTRAGSEDLSAAGAIGTKLLGGLLPTGSSLDSIADISGTGSHTGTGSVDRSETLETKVSAIVTQVLPNGNLVIEGRQEVRVNFEVRELIIAGIVRPRDINASNMVSSDKIAEARISYGGRGQITDVQQPRYGQQVLDVLLPF